ncbi:hypothetical protein LINPERHAP1_LOCUS23278 [Linum perenne]
MSVNCVPKFALCSCLVCCLFPSSFCRGDQFLLTFKLSHLKLSELLASSISVLLLDSTSGFLHSKAITVLTL